MTNDLETAIKERLELFVRVKLSGTSAYKDVRLHPYIYGKDVLGFPFLWGYVPELDIFHKISLYLVDEVHLISISFTPFQNAKYLRPEGEKHYYVVKGNWKYKGLVS